MRGLTNPEAIIINVQLIPVTPDVRLCVGVQCCVGPSYVMTGFTAMFYFALPSLQHSFQGQGGCTAITNKVKMHRLEARRELLEFGLLPIGLLLPGLDTLAAIIDVHFELLATGRCVGGREGGVEDDWRGVA